MSDKPSVREALEVLVRYVSNSECCPEAPLPSREAAGAALAAFDGWDEPITEEWLNEQGWHEDADFPWQLAHAGHSRPITRIKGEGFWWSGGCFNVPLKNRLDLLLLLAALNGEAGG